MTDISPLARLRRPRLLVSAARFGLSAYDRAAALPRLLGARLPGPGPDAIAQLTEIERAWDADRKRGAAGYSVSAHVEALTALMAEVRLWAEVRRA